jgi:hypothetical protein
VELVLFTLAFPVRLVIIVLLGLNMVPNTHAQFLPSTTLLEGRAVRPVFNVLLVIIVRLMASQL